MATVLTIVGNLTKDPEEKDYGSNKNVTKFRVACTDRYKGEDGVWKDGDTAYYNVSAWRTLGKNVASTFKKGDKVIVQGKLKYNEFKREDGTLVNNYDIEATDVGIALTSKTAGGNFEKANFGSTKVTVPVSGNENPWS